MRRKAVVDSMGAEVIPRRNNSFQRLGSGGAAVVDDSYTFDLA